MAQRPYWMGYAASHIAVATVTLGKEKTLQVLAPYLKGANKDTIFTDLDVIRKDNLQEYLDLYLVSLGLQSG